MYDIHHEYCESVHVVCLMTEMQSAHTAFESFGWRIDASDITLGE